MCVHLADKKHDTTIVQLQNVFNQHELFNQYIIMWIVQNIIDEWEYTGMDGWMDAWIDQNNFTELSKPISPILLSCFATAWVKE